MLQSKKIAVLIGSLRKESLNRKTAKALIALAPESLKLQIVELGGLQMYNQDLEESPPVDWIEFRNHLKDFDGFLFVTTDSRVEPSVSISIEFQNHSL